MSCSSNASRPSGVIVKVPEPIGFARPKVRSLVAISAGIGGGSRFASAAPFNFRSQSKSSAVRFESITSYEAGVKEGSPCASEDWVRGTVLAFQCGRHSLFLRSQFPIGSSKRPSVSPAIRRVEVGSTAGPHSDVHQLSQGLVARNPQHACTKLLVGVRSRLGRAAAPICQIVVYAASAPVFFADERTIREEAAPVGGEGSQLPFRRAYGEGDGGENERSEEHTSELQSPYDLVCRLLLEKKKNRTGNTTSQ